VKKWRQNRKYNHYLSFKIQALEFFASGILSFRARSTSLWWRTRGRDPQRWTAKPVFSIRSNPLLLVRKNCTFQQTKYFSKTHLRPIFVYFRYGLLCQTAWSKEANFLHILHSAHHSREAKQFFIIHF